MAPTLLDRIRGTVARTAAKIATDWGGLELVPPWDRKQWIAPTFRNLTNQGFKANGVAFACISTLLSAYTEPPLQVVVRQPGGEEVADPTHDLQGLLDNPNEDMSGLELRQFLLLYRSLSGSCYLWKQRNRPGPFGRVVNLWPLSDAQITPVAGGTRLVERFDFDDGAGGTIKIDKGDIVHLKWMPDPLRPWMGYGPLMAILREVQTDNEATAYLNSLLANDAIPRLKLVLPATLDHLDPEQRKEYLDAYTKGHGGEKRGGVALLYGGMDLQPIALNMRDLEFDALRRVPEARICAAFGVPANIAGMVVGLDTMTYDNVKGLAEQFTDRKLVPMWRGDGAELTQGLVPEFEGSRADRVFIRFDTSDVVALQSRKQARREEARQAVLAGAITVYQYQLACGFAADPEANYYLRGPLVQQVPSGLPAPRGSKAALPAPSARKWKIKAGGSQGARKLAKGLRDLRLQSAEELTPKLDAYFAALGKRAVERFEARHGKETAKYTEQKDDAAGLLSDADVEELANLLRRHTLLLLSGSWELVNQALGVDRPFNAQSPDLVQILGRSGLRIVAITDETLAAIRSHLQQMAEQGWGVTQIIRGDPAAGIPGLEQIVAQTYRNRSENIARTELGTAQNEATLYQYRDEGSGHVLVYDGDGPNSCTECLPYADGTTVWTVAEALANPLAHPQCVRTFGAVPAQELEI